MRTWYWELDDKYVLMTVTIVTFILESAVL